jgi:hypothetical protein
MTQQPYRTQLCAVHARGDRDEESAWGVRPAYGNLACPACRAELDAHDEALAAKPEVRHVGLPEASMASREAQRRVDAWMSERAAQVENEELLARAIDQARDEHADNERKRKSDRRRSRRYWRAMGVL